MSTESSPVSVEHFRYLAERTAGEDDFLRDLKAAADQEGIPSICISPEQASFMQILLKLMAVRRVVEVGTLAGYSAIAMARALPEDGRVQTIEVSGKHADFAEQWIARSDVSGKVTVLRGQALQVLPKIKTDGTDAVFIDADKENYPAYLLEALRILRPGGLIMVDNAFAFGELFADQPSRSDVAAVRGFNELMAGQDRLHSIIVPLGDGCWVGVKQR